MAGWQAVPPSHTNPLNFSKFQHYQELLCEKPCEIPCENWLSFTQFSYGFHNISHMFHMHISHACEIAACEEHMKSM